MDGKDVTITIKHVDPKCWQKPNSNQYWWTVQAENGALPFTKFIQDKDKGVAQPTVGDVVEGKLYGEKFYPKTAAPSGYTGPRGGGHSSAAKLKQDEEKQNTIVAEWAIGKALQYHAIEDLDKVEELAERLVGMVRRVSTKSFNTGSQQTFEKAPIAIKEPKQAASVSLDDDAEFASMLAKGLEADGIEIGELGY